MSSDGEFLVNKAKENLEAVELLIQRNFLEIAASRIYYSMFYLAEALLQSRMLSFSSHSAVIAAFGKEFSRTGDLDPKFHQYLIKSQELRQIGDDGYQSNVSAENVIQALAWAKEFLLATEAFLNVRES